MEESALWTWKLREELLVQGFTTGKLGPPNSNPEQPDSCATQQTSPDHDGAQPRGLCSGQHLQLRRVLLPIVSPTPSLLSLDSLPKWDKILGPSPSTIPMPVLLALGIQAMSKLPLILSWQKPNQERCQSWAPQASPGALQPSPNPWPGTSMVLFLPGPPAANPYPDRLQPCLTLIPEFGGWCGREVLLATPRISGSCNEPELEAQTSGTCSSFPGEGEHNQL